MSKAKPIFTLSLSLSLSLCLVPLLINLIFPLSSFAQTEEGEETLTIATYYPAPYGIYNEMRAKKMAVGDNYYGGSQFCWSPDTCAYQIDGIFSPCWPNCNTDLFVEGSLVIGEAFPIGTDQPKSRVKLDVGGSVRIGKSQWWTGTATGDMGL